MNRPPPRFRDTQEDAMAISPNLRKYLRSCGTSYDEIPHSRTFAAARAAHAAHVSGKNVAKGVMMRAGDDYVLAVLPSSRHVDLARLGASLGCDVRLLSEAEAAMSFPDCEFGAIPPLGEAYGLDFVVDDDLLDSRLHDDDEIYFEGGDHRTLIAIEATDWRRMMSDARHCAFAV
ncbi:aminoacyl-tRNA deacylase [Novosphingobium sp. KN65.2]|uniref:aminoacyl-tRNA deacylase n=1 Tax=Novosphingobium sp. KN65.2 TaxID=1478134 RepID=UPI001E4B7FAD|nr:YbaK/EbsC family protein [Novosphingobium sp. KN65.2]